MEGLKRGYLGPRSYPGLLPGHRSPLTSTLLCLSLLLGSSARAQPHHQSPSPSPLNSVAMNDNIECQDTAHNRRRSKPRRRTPFTRGRSRAGCLTCKEKHVCRTHYETWRVIDTSERRNATRRNRAATSASGRVWPAKAIHGASSGPTSTSPVGWELLQRHRLKQPAST